MPLEMFARRCSLLWALAWLPHMGCDAGQVESNTGQAQSADAAPNDLFEEACQAVDDQDFVLLSTDGSTSDRPAADHGDLNLHLRSWEPVDQERSLVDINGATDALAPKIRTMFADARVPTIVNTYAVHHWAWEQNQPAGPIDEPSVTLVGFAVAKGEAIGLARSGYDIGEGMQARVLYVDQDSLTLVYTRADHVAIGYTLHVVGVCPDPELLRLYQESDAAGRMLLPALRAEQAFGRARDTELMVTIRDSGSFMDPRSRKDWW